MSEIPTNDPPGGEDALAQIIRLAGNRPSAPDDARARAYASVHSAWQQSVVARRRRRVSPTWLAAAAALASLAIGLAILRLPARAPGAELASLRAAHGEVWIARAGSQDWRPAAALAGERLRAGDALRTSGDGRAALDLEHGVSLRLNAQTEIVLAAADRIDMQRGMLYLDSGLPSGAHAPVHVATPLGDVWDIGTQFELRADEQALRIRVREGVVQFEDGDRALRSEAGDELSIPARGEATRAHISAHDAAWDWVSELASFHSAGDYSAATLLEWISRETGRPLRFDSPATQAHAEALRLHGADGLSPRETLDAVVATTDLRYGPDPAAILIYASAPVI